MNKDIMEGSWKQFMGKLKAQWGKLTGHQLNEIDGRRVEVAGKIQQGYGTTKDDAEQQIERLKKPHDD